MSVTIAVTNLHATLMGNASMEDIFVMERMGKTSLGLIERSS